MHRILFRHFDSSGTGINLSLITELIVACAHKSPVASHPHPDACDPRSFLLAGGTRQCACLTGTFEGAVVQVGWRLGSLIAARAHKTPSSGSGA